MRTALQRSPFTSLLLDTLAAVGKPVGDGALPPHAGWQPDVEAPGANYVPFVVLSEVVASRSWGTLYDSQSDWQLPYVIESFGARRDQASWMADAARKTLVGLAGALVATEDGNYGVMQVHLDSLGQPARIDATQPPTWHSQDGITVWITKEN